MLLKELAGVAALVYDTCAITVGYVCGACGSAFWSSIPLELLLFFPVFFSVLFSGCCVFHPLFSIVGGLSSLVPLYVCMW